MSIRSSTSTFLLFASVAALALTLAGAPASASVARPRGGGPGVIATSPKPAAGLGIGTVSYRSLTARDDLLAFYTRSDHGLTLKQDGRTVDLGGYLTSAPAGFDRGLDTIVYARGAGHAIWYRVNNAQGQWQPWKSLGGNAAGAPSVGCSAQGTTTNPIVYVRSPAGALWERPMNGRWQRLGGKLLSDPTATSTDAGNCPFAPADVYAIGADHAVWQRTPSRWERIGGWSAVAPTSLGVPADATGSAAGVEQLFVRGMDHAVWLTSNKRGGAWAPWHRIGGSFTSPVTAGTIFRTNSTLLLGLGRDGNLWQGRNRYGSTRWTWSLVP